MHAQCAHCGAMMATTFLGIVSRKGVAGPLITMALIKYTCIKGFGIHKATMI